MRGEAAVQKPSPQRSPSPQRRAAAVVRLTESIALVANSKRLSKETKTLLASLRQALGELREANAENGQLRDELAIARGRALANPAAQAKVEADFAKLTGREQQVLTLIAAGFSNKQIADDLGITFKTVVSHRTRLMDKLNLHETASLTRYAIRQGLLRP